MHVVGKKTGEPWRVVDLREINKATVRQTHYTEPPFAQAMGIKPRTWKFTTDAWNGYHSVLLDPRDRHKTTFITPWGLPGVSKTKFNDLKNCQWSYTVQISNICLLKTKKKEWALF